MPIGKQAAGNIYPSRFVTASTTYPDSVVQATANSRIAGISQEYQRDAPIPGASTLAAADGDAVKVFVPEDGDDVLLEIADDVNPDDLLESDGDGKGIPMTTPSATTERQIGARALEGGAAGNFIRVRPVYLQVTVPGA